MASGTEEGLPVCRSGPIGAGCLLAAGGGIVALAAAAAAAPWWLVGLAGVMLAGGLLLLLCFAVLPLVMVERVLRDTESGTVEEHPPGPGEDAVRARLERVFALARDAARQEYSALILEKQAELSNLQSQINPHFLYNTLEAIRGKAILEDVPDVAKMAEALAGMFRYSISRRGDMASLEDEIRNVQNYMLIQQYRFDNKFQLELHEDCGRESLLRELPRMTLQPIVENAIYHGLETRMGEGKISIDVVKTDRRLLVTVHDNGVGMDKEKLDRLNHSLRGQRTPPAGEKGGGIALFNVNRRLQLCFGAQSGLRIYSTRGVGTDVEISLPAGENNEKRDFTVGECGGRR